MDKLAPGAFGPMTHTVLPIKIRPDYTVWVQGIPHDLTEPEAARIATVIMAMASPAVTSNDSMDNTEAHTPTRAEVEQITSDDYEPGCVR